MLQKYTPNPEGVVENLNKAAELNARIKNTIEQLALAPNEREAKCQVRQKFLEA